MAQCVLSAWPGKTRETAENCIHNTDATVDSTVFANAAPYGLQRLQYLSYLLISRSNKIYETILELQLKSFSKKNTTGLFTGALRIMITWIIEFLHRPIPQSYFLILATKSKCLRIISISPCTALLMNAHGSVPPLSDFMMVQRFNLPLCFAVWPWQLQKLQRGKQCRKVFLQVLGYSCFQQQNTERSIKENAIEQHQ